MLLLHTCALFHALLIGEGSCLIGSNVCYWFLRLEEYCCFGFEQIGNKCEACKIGFTTTKLGSSCQPCYSYTFGKNCSGMCSCSKFERCDHVYGSCISKEETTTMSEYGSTGNSSDTCSSTKLVNYCVTILCVLLVVSLCFFVKKHQRNLKEKQRAVITDSEDIRVNARANEINAVDDGINTYHVIDESQMDKSRDEPNSGNAYLTVLFSESDSVDDEDSNTCNDGYLDPYHLTREHLSGEFEEESNHTGCTENGYLLSYKALLQRRQSLKHITKTAVIGTEVRESFTSTPSYTSTTFLLTEL